MIALPNKPESSPVSAHGKAVNATLEGVHKPASSASPAKRRIFELDLLRGFFIVVILLDHLQFWPSPLMAFTGEGRLWVSAAEGFFLISGLLIGYIRGYKGMKHSLKTLTMLLWKRAAMLYLWGIFITCFVVGFTMLVGNHPLLPKLPDTAQFSSLQSFTIAVLSGQFFTDWIYFLRLYAIMLFVTPLFLYLLRRGRDVVIIGLIITAYIISLRWPEGALQWQVLFFGAGLIGYRLEAIIAYLAQRPRLKLTIMYGSIACWITTLAMSFFFTHGWWLADGYGLSLMSQAQFETLKYHFDSWFQPNPMSIGRILLAYVWFAGGLFFVHLMKPFVMRWLGWLLLFFGERSLSVYVLQAMVLPIIVVTVPLTANWLLNAVVGIIVVLLHWYILRQNVVARLLPR